MNAISCLNITKSVKDDNLFENVSFGLDEGEKLGIIGKNGAGKSTMLKVLAGILKPDEGSVTVNNSFKVGYLDQDVSFPDGCTINEYLRLFKDERIELLNKFEAGDSSLAHKLEELSVWEIEERYKRFISELGVREKPDTPMNILSGGTRKKIAIARLLAMEQRILLLDEPTNHLDIPAIEWLENYLYSVPFTVILVTHDRYFLDRICSRILEIDRRQVYLYEGGYTDFLTQREERLNAQQKEQDRLATVLRRELEWLKRGPKARTGKDSGRKKRIEEMKDLRVRSEAQDREFSSIQRRMGKKILELKNVSIKRGELQILNDFSLEFVRGQRFGIIGPNGTGKTTLLDIITSNLSPDRGIVDTGINTVFGYYDQNSAALPLDKTPLEFFSDIGQNIAVSSDYVVTPARFLEIFGFPASFHRLPISVLSGGEKRRLYLLSNLVKNPNFLVLDEPTNDLDIDTLRRLEQYVLDFPGVVVTVSHDRAFLDRTCTELIVLPGAYRFEGTYSDWHSECAEQKSQTVKKEDTDTRVRVHEKKGLSFKEQKEYENIEKAIPETEAKIALLEEFFSSGQLDRDGSKQKEYSMLQKQLDEYYMRWEELASKM